MGRMLGAFDNPQELDRPDLNKCPDCECYFAGENCPLCGKPCPEEMKAGNRKPPKKQKQKRSSASRVYFVEWYHRWWFIALAMLIMPIVGIILLITSPHKKSAKITFIAIGVVYLLISTIGIGNIIGMITGWLDPPVNTSLTREEYIGKCTEISAEDYYRRAEDLENEYLCIELKIAGMFYDGETYYNSGEYQKWYICTDESGKFEILVADYLIKDKTNFVSGDVVIFYGEGAGLGSVYDTNGTVHTAPTLNGAYTRG